MRTGRKIRDYLHQLFIPWLSKLKPKNNEVHNVNELVKGTTGLELPLLSSSSCSLCAATGQPSSLSGGKKILRSWIIRAQAPPKTQTACGNLNSDI